MDNFFFFFVFMFNIDIQYTRKREDQEAIKKEMVEFTNNMEG